MTATQVIEKLESKGFVSQVLALVEVGSRSYELHTEDSDRDCYAIFVQTPVEYVQIDTYSQNIHQEEVVDGWEVQGWNVKRFGELALESNPTLMEFIKSDIEHYFVSDSFETHYREFCRCLNEEFNPLSLYHHYNSLIQKNYQKYIQRNWVVEKSEIVGTEFEKYLKQGLDIEVTDLGDSQELSFGDRESIPIDEASKAGFVRETTLDRSNKRTLFILRAVCCAKWVRENGTVPPISFYKLLEEQEFLDEETYQEIVDVADYKKSGKERVVGNKFQSFIEDELDRTINRHEHDTEGVSRERVNDFIAEVF